MNKRFEILETSVNIKRIDKQGDEHDHQDCVAGIEIDTDGVLRIDLRNLRPMRLRTWNGRRVLDRECVIVELYLHDVLSAMADKLEAVVKE
jgi:hypothetical protein